MNHDTKETHEGKHMAQKMKEQLDDATSDKAGLQDYVRDPKHRWLSANSLFHSNSETVWARVRLEQSIVP